MERPPSASIAETVATGLSNGSAEPSLVDLTSSSSADEGRFLPGTLLGGRYRIIGLLGRGGMGEVYRATDLTLGQPVALKFLPDEASRNQRLLERFHGEVRVARLVSHPNVCRVYDIGEVQGVPYISMEYVDGEDLASLLTRIGRLPADKALDTARKLCLGVAAAHDRGVIHRDLKPQNIMINKRGEVVIMDFGLAAITGHLTGSEASNGTPAYMAPEQLRGAEVTARSDIYALGLVIYELFTGKKPYDARTLQQLIDLQESAHLMSMSSVAADIDPVVEKTIRRCLDPDPMKRPATPLAIAAALPGGDPLAAALAAGETPSPEMVAAAGPTEGMPRKYSIPCLLAVILCLLGTMVFRERSAAMVRAQLDFPPEVLAAKSREAATALGYPKKPVDSTVWLEHRSDLIMYLRSKPVPRPWEEWLAAEAPIQSVYRESPAALRADPEGSVTPDNPAPILPGMATVTLDGHGKLLAFSAKPYSAPEGLSDWIPPDAAFRAAGLDRENFRETRATLLPLNVSDTVMAWTGPHPKLPSTELKVEIAWWKGRITQVHIGYPWETPAASTAAAGTAWLSRVREVFSNLAAAVLGIMVLLLALHNWKQGRSDRRGALKVAGARFLLAIVIWMGTVHPAGANAMTDLFAAAVGSALFAAMCFWLIYLALEPAVRSRWPHSIVTWNRVLAGRWRDAQVGANILTGAAIGSAMWLVIKSLMLAISPKNVVSPEGNLYRLSGLREWVGGFASATSGSMLVGLLAFFAIFILRRRLVRNDILAALIAAVLFSLNEGEVVRSGGLSDWLILLAIFILIYGTLAFILLRSGLVTTIAAVFFVNNFNGIMVGTDWKTWYAGPALATCAVLLSIALFGFWRSLGGRELLTGEEAG